jgi:hypothetical protein
MFLFIFFIMAMLFESSQQLNSHDCIYTESTDITINQLVFDKVRPLMIKCHNLHCPNNTLSGTLDAYDKCMTDGRVKLCPTFPTAPAYCFNFESTYISAVATYYYSIRFTTKLQFSYLWPATNKPWSEDGYLPCFYSEWEALCPESVKATNKLLNEYVTGKACMLTRLFVYSL